MKVMILLLCSFVIVYSQENKDSNKSGKWDTFNYFIGKWEGTGSGHPGNSTLEREYIMILNGKFIQVKNKSVYPVQEKNPSGETHEDIGFISYDNSAKKYVFRQFHIEGFVNCYVEEKISEDGRLISFVTGEIENIPEGWKARETYRIINENEFIEVFELAPPGKDFQVYTENTLKRK